MSSISFEPNAHWSNNKLEPKKFKDNINNPQWEFANPTIPTFKFLSTLQDLGIPSYITIVTNEYYIFTIVVTYIDITL